MTLYAKLWVDVLSDPKLMRAVRKGAEQLILLPWIIVFAKFADDDGRLTVAGEPADPIDIAAHLPAGNPKQIAKQVGQCLEELEAIGVLVKGDDGALRFAQWHRRSVMKSSEMKTASAKRKADYRARKRQEREAAAALAGGTQGGTRPTIEHGTQGGTRPTSESESESQSEVRAREKSESQSDTSVAALAVAPSVLAAELPPSAQLLLVRVPHDKQELVITQMRGVLNGGSVYRGQRIQATSARLEAKCRDTLAALQRGRSIENLWAFTLAKLADTSDGSAPGEQEARSLAAPDPDEIQIDRWMQAHSDEVSEMRNALNLAQGPGMFSAALIDAQLRAGVRQRIQPDST